MGTRAARTSAGYGSSALDKLFNAGSAPLNLGGYFLSNDPANRTEWSFPANTVIPARGFLLLWADKQAGPFTGSDVHLPFKLDGAVQKIACPFLMLHGEGDEQIPLSEAQKCFDAVGSKAKTMKMFTREEGGYHHCQIDNQSICSAYMWDWLEQVLKPAR